MEPSKLAKQDGNALLQSMPCICCSHRRVVKDSGVGSAVCIVMLMCMESCVAGEIQTLSSEIVKLTIKFLYGSRNFCR